MENDFFYLGIITKPFGYKGQLHVYLDTDEPEKYANLDAIFINEGGEMLPYMIEEMNYRGGNLAVVKFADVDGNEAKSLLKQEMYLPVSLLPKLTGNAFYYHEVIDYQVVDTNYGNIGVCVGFIDTTQQPIMQIDKEGVEILIPAIDHIFNNVDREAKVIEITAPEGLIDVYLGED